MKIINNELLIREKRINKYKDKIKANLTNDDFFIDNYDLTLCIYTDENYYFVNNLFHEDWFKKHCIILQESDKEIVIEGFKEIKI